MPLNSLVHVASSASVSYLGQRPWRAVAAMVLLLFSISACTVNDQPAADSTVAGGAQTALPAPSAGQPTPTFVPLVAGQPGGRTSTLGGATTGATVELDDGAWNGGYRRANGGTYGGRTATWIYGTATEWSTMQATFLVEAQPFGTAELSVEGMDSEGADKTPIVIAVNGHEIYSGPNLLPDDDLPFDSGTWDTYTWTFNAQVLQPGTNTITIANGAVGAFSRPPFFMLDYAELAYEAQ
ncbi:MAG: hypothetical protein M3R24_25640 [Chloroflexota bacterium]|nr:hypothetical protein [Chloroflexota bacterium]